MVGPLEMELAYLLKVMGCQSQDSWAPVAPPSLPHSSHSPQSLLPHKLKIQDWTTGEASLSEINSPEEDCLLRGRLCPLQEAWSKWLVVFWGNIILHIPTALLPSPIVASCLPVMYWEEKNLQCSVLWEELFKLDIELFPTTSLFISLFPFLDCRSRKQARSAELLTDCCSEQGSQLSTIPFWNCKKPEESAGHYREMLVDHLQESEGLTEHVANGLWEMLADSIGNPYRLLVNCSCKIFSSKRDHWSFSSWLLGWPSPVHQIRDAKEGIKESWGNSSQATTTVIVNGTKRWWWVEGVFVSLMTLRRSLVLVNTLGTASCWNLEPSGFARSVALKILRDIDLLKR